MKFPDGSEALIYGDIPHKLCGWQGFISTTEVDTKGSGANGHRPYCFWLDGDDTGYVSQEKQQHPHNQVVGFHMPRSVSFHIPDFDGQNGTIAAYKNDKALMCGSAPRLDAEFKKTSSIPVFKPQLVYPDAGIPEEEQKPTYLDPAYVRNPNSTRTARREPWPLSQQASSYDCIAGLWGDKDQCKEGHSIRSASPLDASEKPGDESEGPRGDGVAASAPPARPWYESQLVVSKSKESAYFAETLCNDPTVTGPDYVNTHGAKRR